MTRDYEIMKVIFEWVFEDAICDERENLFENLGRGGGLFLFL